jgi:hypothetical protein
MVMARTHELRSFSVRDFGGGLNVRQNPQILASSAKFRNCLTLSRNTAHPKTGGVSKRFDVATVNSSTIGSSVTCIGGVQFRHSNGTDYNIAAWNDGTVRRLNSDGTTTTLKSGLSTATQASFAQYNDLLIYTDRVNAPQSYDGTTWQALAGSPPSTGGPVIVHGNRALMLDATNTRRLSWSKLSDPENWTASSDAGSMVVSGPVGSPLVGLLRMTNEVLLGHRDYVTRLQGTSPSTYALTNAVPAQVSTGVISPLAMIFSNNDARWISQRGIHSLGTTQDFGDLLEKFTSERIDPYFTANTDYTISLNQLSKSCACYDSQNNRDLFAVDTDGDGKNDLIFVRDVFTGAFSTWPSMSCASLWPAHNGAAGYEVWMGGYDGFVRRLNVDASTNAIDARFNHLSDLGDSTWAKSLRHLYVHLREEGVGTLTVTTNIDYGASGGQTYSISLLGNSAVLGSTFVLGTSTLGNRSQIIKRLNVSGVGVYWEIGFGNSATGQNFTVYSYDASWRRRRFVGRASSN